MNIAAKVHRRHRVILSPNKYGALYNAYAMNNGLLPYNRPSNYQHLALPNWTMPTTYDWGYLLAYANDPPIVGMSISGNSNNALKLRSIGSDFWNTLINPNDSTDIFNFNMKAAGAINCYYTYNSYPNNLLFRDLAAFWDHDGSSPFSSISGHTYLSNITVGFNDTWEYVMLNTYSKIQGFSIRFIKQVLSESDLLKTDGQYCDDYIDYDGNHYKTVKINGKVWMPENLAVTHFTDGTPISVINNLTDWNNTRFTNAKAMAWPNFDEANK